jgi:quinohemoprotein amine dehydrogenase
VVIVGNGLAGGAVSFGAGVGVRVVAETAAAATATVTVAADADTGARVVTKGAASAAGAFAVYRQVDVLDVRPGYGIARLGGGKLAPVTAQFEAVGATRLADGSLLPLGVLPVEWSVRPFDAEAKRTDDPRFAGRLEANGRFVPAGAGPNREREFSGNNVGNLAIVARLADGARPVEGAGHLIVTVQRWNTPPIY